MIKPFTVRTEPQPDGSVKVEITVHHEAGRSYINFIVNEAEGTLTETIKRIGSSLTELAEAGSLYE